jgi:hypothetical protein
VDLQRRHEDRWPAAGHSRPPVVFGQFLAALGLLVWVVYVIDDSQGLAWVAFVDLVVVAGLGDTLVYRWVKDRRVSDARRDQLLRASRRGRWFEG